jgi:prolipoprotein diacylglyceryl transferase
MFIHDFSPEIVQLGPLAIRWYGVLFVIGIVLAYWVAHGLFKKRGWKLEHLDSLAIYLFFGLVIGARLGHVFFYNSKYFLENPVEILKIWNGGLASHGAAIGVFVAYLLWSKIYKVKFGKYPDTLIIVFPLVAGFVRLGNFMNSEIVGVRTDSGIGVVFKQLGENFARHPVQLYSALMNFAIFGFLYFVYQKYYKKVRPLFFLFLYMLVYFVGRFVVEFWKDLHWLPESFPLSMGQMLSLVPILIAVGWFGFVFFGKKK